ncbi:MAG: PRC-barrel domain-containing protein [Elusimicrobiota bacterium]|jgi:16S rRNA processing protein RimM|nr:PRC-barrel domain-containing protein [Elusimicrobiota bacterium]
MTQKIKWKISEVLGFDIFNQSSEYLGVLYDVLATGSNDIWVVRHYNNEILIPALKDIVKEVNASARKIFVFLPNDYKKTLSKAITISGESEYNGYTIYED